MRKTKRFRCGRKPLRAERRQPTPRDELSSGSRENHASASGTWTASRVTSTTTRGLSTSTEDPALPGLQKSTVIQATIAWNTTGLSVNTDSNE